jgi:hypothetical protein
MASRLRQIALNTNAGAFVDVLASGPCRAIEMMEDEANAVQGLQVKSSLDSFATTNDFTFGSQPLTIPPLVRYPNSGPLLGMNAQGTSGAFNYRAADKLASLRSNGAAATTLRFIEHD